MSRVLFDARSFAETGGVSRVARRVLDHVRSTRPNDEMVTITTGFIDSGMRTDGAQSLHVKLPNKLWSLACILGLISLDQAAAMKSGKRFDELILPNIGFVGTPAIPYTIIVHDLSFLIEPKWFPWKMRVWHTLVRASRLIKRATNIWCVSETTARDVERLLGVDRARITILSPDVIVGATLCVAPDVVTPDPIVARQSLAPTIDARYILAFDGSPRKNISTVIAAVNRVRENERFRDVQLIIIGRDRHPTDAELNDLYAGASALLYPSWYEGFGLPLHEAAAYGVPILASAHGALPETAPPGSLLINPAKPHLWAAALRNTLEQGSIKQ